MFEFTLLIEEHRALFASRLVAIQIAVQSGEARNHLVGDDAIGFASFRRELINPATDWIRIGGLRLFGHQP